jgi:threonine dehydrogenase-like Zn-dependent dehydrogenase
VAFDFAGVPSVREQALRLLGPRGRLVLVGLANAPVGIGNDTYFTYMQQRVLGSYGSEPQHVLELVHLAAHGRLDLSRSVSDVLPLSEAPQAIERLQSKQGNPIRLVLQP